MWARVGMLGYAWAYVGTCGHVWARVRMCGHLRSQSQVTCTLNNMIVETHEKILGKHMKNY